MCDAVACGNVGPATLDVILTALFLLTTLDQALHHSIQLVPPHTHSMYLPNTLQTVFTAIVAMKGECIKL